jgi:alpha-L-fucosidase 2
MGMTLGRGSFAPIQLDASMGVVNALQEMLLFVSDGIVKLLPALPKRLSKGSVKDLRFMTGQISFEWTRRKEPSREASPPCATPTSQ